MKDKNQQIDDELNQRFMAHTRRLINLEDTGLTPGQMLAILRRVNNVSSAEFCTFMDISPETLSDIENNRVPFPTMFLMFLFIHGFRSWYFGDDKE